MYVSTTPKKRSKPSRGTSICAVEEEVRENGHTEKWFSGNHDQIAFYLHEVSKKVTHNPKFLRVEWLEGKSKQCEVYAHASEKLENFLNRTKNLYPDLVRVFFTNPSFEDEVMYSHAKGVDMEITPAVWTVVAGLKNTRRIVGKGHTSSLEDYNMK